MTDLIMQLASVIQREVDTLKDVSQNAANANTPGYRATRTFNIFESTTAVNNPSQDLGLIQARSDVKTENGALQQTGRLTDLALSGHAWFVLQTPQGPQLTRDGRFQVNAAGTLVNNQGYAVLGDDGPIEVPSGNLMISSDGVLRVNNDEVGRLRIVQLSSGAKISPGGHGLYVSDGEWAPAGSFEIHQGALERSNVEFSAEMVKIMEASRHVESMQRALNAYDTLLSSGINQLGKD